MDRYFKIATLLVALCPLIQMANAADLERLLRTERPTYVLREDAMRGVRSNTSQYLNFEDWSVVLGKDGEVLGEYVEFTPPYEWLNSHIMLHLEGGDRSRSLMINGEKVATNTDFITPADYDITEFVKESKNRIDIVFVGQQESPVAKGVIESVRPKMSGVAGMHLYTEPRRRVFDYSVTLQRDSSEKFAWLDIAAVVENGYNYAEPLTVGFDIYDPKGTLLDYSSRSVTIEGNSCDTVRFSARIYHTDKYRWSPDQPALYHVTLLTKSGSVVESYTPVKLGFSQVEYRDGAIYNFGERVELNAFNFNAMESVEQTEKELLRLKDAGYNALRPRYPQPLWFYDLCDRVGFYIVEQANINAIEAAHDRSIGGSASNNPELLDDYLQRVKSSYYRVQHHPSVIAFSLGEASGNGYNMYKAYEWMKGVERRRPVIYKGAQGEWNSDELEL